MGDKLGEIGGGGDRSLAVRGEEDDEHEMENLYSKK